MKKPAVIIIVIIAILFVVSFVKDLVIKSVVTFSISSVTGAPVKIDGFSLGFLKQSIRIKGFKLYSPKGFGNDALLDITRMELDYDLGSLFKKELHIRRATLDLKEAVIVRNSEGKLSVDSLKVAQKPQKPVKAGEGEKVSNDVMPLSVDHVYLNLGKVVFKDYQQNEQQPFVQAYDINVKNKEYKNIKSVNQFILLVLIEAMRPTALKSAGIYAAATVLSVGFLPAGVVGVLVGKDDVTTDFKSQSGKVYNVALETVKKNGQVTSEDKNAGFIQAKVNGCDVKVRVTEQEKGRTHLEISARKMMIPQPQVANGLLYQISEKVK